MFIALTGEWCVTEHERYNFSVFSEWLRKRTVPINYPVSRGITLIAGAVAMLLLIEMYAEWLGRATK